MASTRDVQDMLGLPTQQGPRPKPSKKGKKDTKKGLDGSQWNKELKSLMGERAPPIPLSTGPKWKDKRSRMMGPVRKWRMTPFKNDARTDGLLLRHWQRVAEDQLSVTGGADVKSEELEQKQLEAQEPYRFSKYNQSVSAPSFTQQEYEDNLKNDRWSEDETRYLLTLYSDFAGKWPLIADRYDWPLPSQDDNTATPPNLRRMEDLKHRYYDISAKLMSLRIPAMEMTESQDRDHGLMSKFNPQHELTRKKFKEQQMSRSRDEMNEERYLLAELKRIYTNQERFDVELRELRARVDHSLTDDKLGPHAYTSSTELTQMFQKFASQDKAKAAQQKLPPGRRSIGDAAAAAAAPPTASATSPTSAITPGGPATKKSHPADPPTRQLTPRAETRFAVSTHDRLTSGVSFVSDKMAKVRSPTKSAAQNAKIAAILAEVGIPEVMQMQTPHVCEEMEKLVEMALGLLKNRAATEKVENEILVVWKGLEMEGLVEAEADDTVAAAGAVGGEEEEEEEEEKEEKRVDEDEDDEERDGDEADAGEGEGEGEDPGEGDIREIKREEQDIAATTDPDPDPPDSQTASRKRSASVLSAASAASRGGPKRKGARK